MLDGEVVAVDDRGHPSFQALQHRSALKRHHLVYYVFDLLNINGRDLMGEALEQRKARLPQILRGTSILMSENLPGNATAIVAAARALELEGVIAKRKTSRYEPGRRSGAWVKLKLDRQQEFVVGGYKPDHSGFDSLLVGYYEGRQLKFAGRVRAGFTPALRQSIFARVKRLEIDTCPFLDLPNSTGRTHWGEGITAEDMRSLRWVKPRVVVQVRFVEWTADVHLRHSAFVGIRDDKRPQDVRRESVAVG